MSSGGPLPEVHPVAGDVAAAEVFPDAREAAMETPLPPGGSLDLDGDETGRRFAQRIHLGPAVTAPVEQPVAERRVGEEGAQFVQHQLFREGAPLLGGRGIRQPAGKRPRHPRVEEIEPALPDLAGVEQVIGGGAGEPVPNSGGLPRAAGTEQEDRPPRRRQQSGVYVCRFSAIFGAMYAISPAALRPKRRERRPVDGQCLRFVGRRVAGHPSPSGRGLIARDLFGATVSAPPDKSAFVGEGAPFPEGVAAFLDGLEVAGLEEPFPSRVRMKRSVTPGRRGSRTNAGAPPRASTERRC